MEVPARTTATTTLMAVPATQCSNNSSDSYKNGAQTFRNMVPTKPMKAGVPTPMAAATMTMPTIKAVPTMAVTTMATQSTAAPTTAKVPTMPSALTPTTLMPASTTPTNDGHSATPTMAQTTQSRTQMTCQCQQ